MKKALVLIAFLMLAGGLSAEPSDNTSSPHVSKYGSCLFNDSMISYGVNPGAQSGNAIPCTAHVAITAGDIVTLVAGASPFASYKVCVSKTATAYDNATFGVAVTTQATGGKTVYVRTNGVCRVYSSINSVAGSRYVTSATAGEVTGTAITAEALLTPISCTAIVVTALETKACGAGGYFLALIGK
jgi:hypothetical protein